MILDIQKFIRSRRTEWDEFEAMVADLEANSRAFDLDEIRRFHYLYEKTAADLMKLKTFASEPQTRSYLESLIARAYGEMHGSFRRPSLWKQFSKLMAAFPAAIRRHVTLLYLTLGLFSGGLVFGGLALSLDATAKPVLMPFSHLLGDPSERVAEEERQASNEDPMEGGKSTFSAYLMTHNTKVAILTLALGMTFGIGTGVLLFYNGTILGAVIADYILAGETVFLTAWLLPHGSVEIPAILLAGQGGLLLGKALLFAEGRHSLGQRLQMIRDDLIILIAGIAVLLIWAGIIESFMSQYHEPILPYSAKIGFGVVQLSGLVAYVLFFGRDKPVEQT